MRKRSASGTTVADLARQLLRHRRPAQGEDDQQ